MAVTPRSIKCGGFFDGTECQEFTTITAAQYVYDQATVMGEPKTYTLKEIHYRAFCPRLRRAHDLRFAIEVRMNLTRLYAEHICPVCGHTLDFAPWKATSFKKRLSVLRHPLRLR